MPTKQTPSNQSPKSPDELKLNGTIRSQNIRLEAEISNRTSELQETNNQLEKEVELRKRAEAELAKRSANELEKSEARFKAMFESAGIGIALVGTDRQALMVNDALVEMSGFSREELLGTNGIDLSYPEDREIGLPELQELINEKISSYQVERRYIHKNGLPYWVRQTVSAVRQPDGKLVYLVTMVEDINQQKQGQEMLRESEARFKAMFESSAMGVLILDVNSMTLRANTAARSILDDPDVDRTLQNVYEFIDDKYRAVEQDLLEQVLKGERDFYDAVHRYQRPGEEPRWAKVTFSSVREVNGQVRYLVAMIEEITEQKKAQDNLVQSEAASGPCLIILPSASP